MPIREDNSAAPYPAISTNFLHDDSWGEGERGNEQRSYRRTGIEARPEDPAGDGNREGLPRSAS